MLEFPESVLAEEEPSATLSLGDDEEGAITDPGSEIVDKESQKLQVMSFSGSYYFGVFTVKHYWQVLDRLLWYLRVVHSVDFYNAMVFPSEDCMPHRCCIFTVRPSVPSSAPSLEDGEAAVTGCDWFLQLQPSCVVLVFITCCSKQVL